MSEFLIPPAPAKTPIVRIKGNDSLQIGDHAHRMTGRLLTGYRFQAADDPDRTFDLSHAEILEMLDSKKAKIIDGSKKQTNSELDHIYRGKTLKSFSVEQQLDAHKLKKLIQRYKAAIARGAKLPRSDRGPKKFQTWLNEESRLLNNVLRREGSDTSDRLISTSQFNRQFLRFERAGGNILALMPRHNGPGQRAAVWTPEAYDYALEEASAFKSSNKPSKEDVFNWYKSALGLENELREKRGQPLLYQFGKTKFYEIIDSFPAFDVLAAREGVAYAHEYFAPNMSSYFEVRPGSIVQMDELKTDMMTIVTKAGQYKKIPRELHKFLKKIRIWVVVAICVSTRAVLAVHATVKPNAQAAIDTLRMVMSDKSRYAELAGAQSGWRQRAKPEQIHADNGSAFISEAFADALDALGIPPTHPPARKPKKRPHIESLFHTIGPMLTAFFSGRTFRNIAEKGDYDPKQCASLVVSEFVHAFRLGVLDVYHLKAHASLGGRSPFNVWNDACSQYEWDYPDHGEMLHAFGKIRTGVIGDYGIVKRDICYWNDELTRQFIDRGKQPIRYKDDESNVASILVEGKDGRWFEVENQSGVEDGVTAEQWNEIRAQERQRNKEETDRDAPIVNDAISRLRQMGHDAAERAGLPPLTMPQEKIDKARAQIFTGYDEGPKPGSTRPTTGEVFDELRSQVSSRDPHPLPEAAPQPSLPGAGTSYFDYVREED